MDRVAPAVAFFGRAGSGKTTAARVLARRGWGIVSLAGPLKRMLLQLPGVTDEHVYGSLKEEPIAPYGKSAREMLQTLGSEWGRDRVHREVWLRVWSLQRDRLAEVGQPAVCDDGRFPDEVEYLRARGVRCVLVRRDEADGQPVTHASESLDPDEVVFDAVLDSNGPLDRLEHRVANLLFDLKLHHVQPLRVTFG